MHNSHIGRNFLQFFHFSVLSSSNVTLHMVQGNMAVTLGGIAHTYFILDLLWLLSHSYHSLKHTLGSNVCCIVFCPAWFSSPCSLFLSLWCSSADSTGYPHSLCFWLDSVIWKQLQDI